MQSSISRSLRTCAQCIRRHPIATSSLSSSLNPLRLRSRYFSTAHGFRSSSSFTANPNPLRSSSNNARTHEQEIASYRRSMVISAAGIVVCAVAMFGVIKLDLFGLDENNNSNSAKENGNGKEKSTMKLDGPTGFTPNPSIIRIKGEEGTELVETGTSSVPHFPNTIRLPKSLSGGGATATKDGEEEYQLLGLGIRSVSFLKIQVYVVGLYVAKSDISELQRRLVHTAVSPPTQPLVASSNSTTTAGSGDSAANHNEVVIISNPVGATAATSLVSTEREKLKELLLDPEQGDAAWDAILRENGLRTAFRIVPTRNTDFLHLRDGFVRGLTARAQKANLVAQTQARAAGADASAAAAAGEFKDESFGVAVNEFKSLFSSGPKKNVAKGQTLLLVRGPHGELDALFQADEKQPLRHMGRVQDERISRLVWLNYLAGKTVSSERARQSVVEGVMGIVERPVGTLDVL